MLIPGAIRFDAYNFSCDLFLYFLLLEWVIYAKSGFCTTPVFDSGLCQYICMWDFICCFN